MADAPIIAMLADACFGLGADEEFNADLRSFLEKHAVAQDDMAALLGAKNRLGIYRRLIRNNLTDVTRKMLRRTRSRMNEGTDAKFDRTFDQFLHHRGPRTPHLRDVPHEFLEWALPLWRGDGSRRDGPWALGDALSYLTDLARYELAEFALGAQPDEADDATQELEDVALDCPVVFAPGLRLDTYAFAVHRLPDAESDRTVPDARNTALLGYRDSEFQVRFLELSPFVATMVDELRSGAALGAALAHTGLAHRATLGVELLSEVAQVLADFGERGIVLGGARRLSG